jgi:hypothetical protein
MQKVKLLLEQEARRGNTEKICMYFTTFKKAQMFNDLKITIESEEFLFIACISQVNVVDDGRFSYVALEFHERRKIYAKNYTLIINFW